MHTGSGTYVVCVVYACECMGGMPVCTHVEARAGHWVSSSVTLHLLCARPGLSLNSKIPDAVRLAGQ